MTPTGGPRTVETAFNLELARQLRLRHPRWREDGAERDAVAAEQTRVLGGRSRGRRPDIVIRHPGGLPVVVETEFLPAASVEREAEERLGESIGGHPVEGALAVRIPDRLAGRQDDLEGEIGRARFEYCLLSSGKATVMRWPREGWISADLDQLAEAIEHAALSETRLTDAADTLEEGIVGGAEMLRGHLTGRPDMFTRMAGILHQEDGEQTTRMAVAIIANAFVFQGAIAGNHGIPSPDEFREEGGQASKLAVVSCWEGILRINYWPIFRLAADLLDAIPGAVARHFLGSMIELADRLAGLGAASMHDLSGQMFQRLIADRKFLATFYTLPVSATLLAGMAVGRLQVDWGDREAVGGLAIADLACGTGSLLGAAQHAVSVRHRRAGGDDRELHGTMMERVLVAADIMPAATHLTASTVSSAHPGSTFGGTRIFTMPYGAENDEVRIGSLDLILDEEVMSLFGTGATTRSGGRGESTAQEAVLAHRSCDLVIMNPPFTNPTNHERTGAPVPSFAGFGTEEDEQKAMSERLESIRRRLKGGPGRRRPGILPDLPPAGHGNAGLASNFIDLAHAKLRPGGCLALVLPASFVQGAGWRNARQLLTERYMDITIVGISTDGSTDRAFSADTGMAEVLLLATRNGDGRQNGECRATVVSLRARPESRLAASLVADSIEASRRGGSASGELSLGETHPSGSYLNAPFATAFRAFGLRHLKLADVMANLESGRLLLPRMAGHVAVGMTHLYALGERGAGHRDISGAGRRGPFDIVRLEPGEYPDWPVLWSHDAARERRLVVAPDSKGAVRTDCEGRAVALWERTASRLHFNNDFRMNSQPLAACLTAEPAMGGTAWPNFLVERAEWETPLLLWANTTLGLMSFWWLGVRQQAGRSRISISRLPGLLAIDARMLSDRQLEQAGEILRQFRERSFLPANEAYRDDVRQELDRAVLVELMGLDEAVLDHLRTLREQWCREPSVHGGKSSRPDGA